LSLKYSTLTIIGILGILINEVEKFNFVNWNSGQTFFGLNLKRRQKCKRKKDKIAKAAKFEPKIVKKTKLLKFEVKF